MVNEDHDEDYDEEITMIRPWTMIEIMILIDLIVMWSGIWIKIDDAGRTPKGLQRIR